MRTTIKSIHAREILDSRGNPTVEVDVTLEGGVVARAASPSGASTGKLEAVELRDKEARYGGKGVQNAVNIVNSDISSLLVGKDVCDQGGVDKLMVLGDGMKDKGRFGGNSTIAVSMAVARAAAMIQREPLWRYLGSPDADLLPVPMMNVLNGGVHANWQGPDFQEYMIAPYGAKAFREALRWGAETYQALKAVLKKKGYSTAVGDEGGFVIKASSNEEPLELMVEAMEEANYTPGKDIGIALDPASSSFFENGLYLIRSEGRHYKAQDDRLMATVRSYSSGEMIDRYTMLIDKYPIISIEDGLAEEDWDGWKEMNSRLGGKIELVGDDIFVTNVELIERGIKENVANAVLIKPNQIGTVTETMNAIKMALNAGWGYEISHRSGETVDSFIADLAVATSSGHMKTGAPARGERVEKYNQLLRIEELLGERARFPGVKAFKNTT
jgi:enolase